MQNIAGDLGHPNVSIDSPDQINTLFLNTNRCSLRIIILIVLLSNLCVCEINPDVQKLYISRCTISGAVGWLASVWFVVIVGYYCFVFYHCLVFIIPWVVG